MRKNSSVWLCFFFHLRYSKSNAITLNAHKLYIEHLSLVMWSFSMLYRLILMDCAGIKRVKIPVALYIEPRLFDVCKTLRLCAADALSSIFWLSFCYKLCMIRYDAMWYDTLVHHIRLKSMCIYCAMQRQRIFFFLLNALPHSNGRSSPCLCTGIQKNAH